MPAHNVTRRSIVLTVLTISAIVLLTSCSNESNAPAGIMAEADSTEDESPAETVSSNAENILLSEWEGPYGGVPAFDQMNLEDLKPAIEAGMAEELAEVNAIANNIEPPNFANTIEAMQRRGRTLDRVLEYYSIWGSNLSSPEFREIQEEMSAKLADFRNRIIQNTALFDRVRTVYESEEMQSLRPDQQRLVTLTYEDFILKGAALEGEAKQRYAEIAQQLATLQTEFSNNVLADEEDYVVYLGENQLAGLPDSVISAAAAAADERGQPGKFAITNTRSSMDPFLTYSEDRDLREKVWTNYYSRGDNGDEKDNNEIITKILQLRKERVNLLGFDTFAEWQLSNRMAKDPYNAFELMLGVWPAATTRVEEEVADMQAIADQDGIIIEPWDYRYYTEKVRQAKYDLNSEEVKQYLQLEKLREAMFYVAGELFDFQFTPVAEGSVPVFHPDVRVWEVTRKSTGDHIGLWYLDPYSRPGKRSGAWATTYRAYETFDGKTNVLAANNSNFVKGAPGESVLISWDDAETLFHEFGHSLHYLSSNIAYPGLDSGVRDYTEFQSQLLERWIFTDPVIDNYLVHVETGEPIPDELIAKIEETTNFNQGFATTEYLASALMDMYFHTVDPEGLDADEFERRMLSELDMPEELTMRHRSPHFRHIFGGESYAAGYYGYMWADVLTADAAEAFEAAPGGYYDPEMSEKLVKYLFAPRNEMDPADAYRAFRGRDADVEAIMRDRGFTVPAE